MRRVEIGGAGIAGLTAAINLAKSGFGEELRLLGLDLPIDNCIPWSKITIFDNRSKETACFINLGL